MNITNEGELMEVFIVFSSTDKVLAVYSSYRRAHEYFITISGSWIKGYKVH